MASTRHHRLYITGIVLIKPACCLIDIYVQTNMNEVNHEKHLQILAGSCTFPHRYATSVMPVYPRINPLPCDTRANFMSFKSYRSY
jgi:hypothetical protein